MWERKPSAAFFSPEIAMFQFHTQKKVVLPQTSTIMKHDHMHYHDRSVSNSEDLRKVLSGKVPGLLLYNKNPKKPKVWDRFPDFCSFRFIVNEYAQNFTITN